MTRNRSRKRSAASSSEKPLKAAAFYLDESIYSRVLCEALEGADVVVHRPGVAIPFGTPDAAWLDIAGSQGWIVLMRDQRVRHRLLELQALDLGGEGWILDTSGTGMAVDSECLIRIATG